MSTHIEWAVASEASKSLSIAPVGDVNDAFGNTNEKPALVLNTGSSLMVIEGSRRELRRLLLRALLKLDL